MSQTVKKKILISMGMVTCFSVALAAPDIAMKTPVPETIGYLAAIGFLLFAGKLWLSFRLRG